MTRTPPEAIDRARLRADVVDPRTVGYGRMPQRGERTAGDTVERVSLRGEWAFRWTPTWEAARLDAAALAEPEEAWDRMPVPGVWETRGFGIPYYLAFRYPPAIGVRGAWLGRIDPAETPTGVYRRVIEVPADWADRRITLRFEGVKSAFHLLVDGALVGYSEGSMTGATFDLTERVTPGIPITVVVIVHRYSTGTYLEDQDMWFLSGITRDVWLEAEPAHAPWDVSLRTDFDPVTGLGALRVRVEGGSGAVRVEVDGAAVAEAQATYATVDIEATELDVRPWSAEHPHLHNVTVTTTADDGAVDVRRFRAGFRRVEIVGEQLRVNGRAIVLHGVNRHDFDPVGIWDVPSAVRERDIALMKRANVNALRMSHYPNPDEVYRLCDEYGLYVMDEAEIESHGVRRQGVPGDDPAWHPSVVARIEAMVRRSRSHACVIIWSLGNEAGDGEAFRVAKRTVRALDDRPVHYEGDTTLETSDVFSLMYPTPQLEQRIGEGRDVRIGVVQNILNALAADTKAFPAAVYTGRPVIACEFAHAMENSFGNAAAHVENFHRYPRWAGGFVWDWVDQTIDLPLPEGSASGAGVRRAYGGAFGDRPTDRWFCANGLVAADRTPNPSYAELAKVYQHVVVEWIGEGRQTGGVRLRNRHAFDDLEGLTLRWRVERDGESVREGEVADAVTPPGGEREVPLPEVEEALITAGPGSPGTSPGLWVLTVELFRRDATSWAEAGHVTAWEQFEIARVAASASASRPWRRTRNRHLVHLDGDRAGATVDVRRGAITSLRFDGAEALRTPLSLNLWRAPTDNDRGLGNFAPVLEAVTLPHAWRRATERARATRHRVGPGRLEIEWRVRGALARLTVSGDDAGVRVGLSITSTRHELVRAGLIGGVDADRVEWLGRGPGENYRDRKSGSRLGLWFADIGEFVHSYPHPQENGNRTDLERLTLIGGGAVGIPRLHIRRLRGGPFEASVRPYPQELLASAAYADELPASGPATLSLDVAHRGVGGDKPGELLLQPEGRLPVGETFFTEWLFSGGAHVEGDGNA